jgi:hypothetical protein
MKSNKTTVILQNGDTKYKLMKIIFTNDGSYSVTAPYHNEKKAFLFKAVVDYTKNGLFYIDKSDTIENTSLEDDDLALKLSHHPSGFLQFSGKGIRSGQNADGSPIGMGIQSWTFSAPVPGPAFSVTIKNYRDMAKSTLPNAKELCIRIGMISGASDDTITCIEGYFIPKQYEHLIYEKNNAEYVVIEHPAGALNLHVVRPKQIRNYFGFVGLHVYALKVNPEWKNYEYFFSTSTGNLVWEGKKMVKGTCLMAMYPNIETQRLPSLNWTADSQP